MTFAALKAEVSDLEARRGTLNRDERARLPFARKALDATPEQQAINRADRAQINDGLRSLLEQARMGGL